MSHNPDPLAHRFGRGVYNAWFRGPAGERVMYSVTHDGRRLTEALIADESNAQAINATLWDELDRVDPVLPIRRGIIARLWPV